MTLVILISSAACLDAAVSRLMAGREQLALDARRGRHATTHCPSMMLLEHNSDTIQRGVTAPDQLSGMSRRLFGRTLLPVGTLYDPFIAGLDALNCASIPG